VRVALDTNVLAYVEGVNGPAMKTAALDVVQRLPEHTIDWADSFPVIETSPAVLFAATDLATEHQLSIWDAVILSAAAEAGCRLLLSEDLQDGFTWRGVTVTNPFAPSRHALLGALLEQPGQP